MKKSYTLKNRRNLKSRNHKKTKKKIGGGLFGPTKRYFRDLYDIAQKIQKPYVKKKPGAKMTSFTDGRSIYREYINSTKYNEYIVNKKHTLLPLGYFIDLTEINNPKNTKTVFFNNNTKYRIDLINEESYFIIENKEYSENQMKLKKYQTFNEYLAFKEYMKSIYSKVNNNTELELLEGYNVYSYEKKNSKEGIYHYVGEIEEASIKEKYGYILIRFNYDSLGMFVNREEIYFSEYNITPENFSSIEIDSYNKIIIIRCNGCSDEQCKCQFTVQETKSEYLGNDNNNNTQSHQYYTNNRRKHSNNTFYSPLSSVSSKYSNTSSNTSSIIYDPRTIQQEVEYSLAHPSKNKVDYVSFHKNNNNNGNNTNPFRGFSIGQLGKQNNDKPKGWLDPWGNEVLKKGK